MMVCFHSKEGIISFRVIYKNVSKYIVPLQTNDDSLKQIAKVLLMKLALDYDLPLRQLVNNCSD